MTLRHPIVNGMMTVVEIRSLLLSQVFLTKSSLTHIQVSIWIVNNLKVGVEIVLYFEKSTRGRDRVKKISTCSQCIHFYLVISCGS